MTVNELRAMLDEWVPEECGDCEIVVKINDSNMDITGITHHGYYTKPGGLPYELVIR